MSPPSLRLTLATALAVWILILGKREVSAAPAEAPPVAAIEVPPTRATLTVHVDDAPAPMTSVELEQTLRADRDLQRRARNQRRTNIAVGIGASLVGATGVILAAALDLDSNFQGEDLGHEWDGSRPGAWLGGGLAGVAVGAGLGWLVSRVFQD